ncbi:DUF6233 domain-containing protein [Streptomyces sp. NRRL S-337]|uniref:DUF6233 domain-containing protein n=1 Tax=Streptomyces sp. NRRL S-337 TaxID=1463900 RepID=UPI0004C92521|nr:DUF6233 domain-containing protein [Streptomyces sp. NRRL S-337]
MKDDQDDFTLDVSAPLADVTLPDGQHLKAQVLRRRRDRSGTWWYDLRLEVPDRVDDRSRRPSLGVRTVEICVPHPYCRAIPGEDYSSLDLPPPHERKRWRLSPAPPGDGWADAYLHRLDCASAESVGGTVTDQEALEALAGDDPTTVACPVCRPDAVLRHRP